MSGRSPYLASGLGHLVVLAGLVTLSMLQPAPLYVPGVHIVAPFPGGGGGQTEVAPEPETKVEAPKPPPPKPVEPVKEPETKSPVERKHETPPEPHGVRPARKDEIVSKSRGRPKDVAPTPPVQVNTPATGPASGGAQAGAGSGGVGYEAEGDIGPLSGYLGLLRDKVAMNWRPPPGVGRTGVVTAVVSFKIPPGGGAPLGVALVSGSGNTFFDRNALSAVVSAAPLQPLPATWTGGTIDIRFTFHQEY